MNILSFYQVNVYLNKSFNFQVKSISVMPTVSESVRLQPFIKIVTQEC